MGTGADEASTDRPSPDGLRSRIRHHASRAWAHFDRRYRAIPRSRTDLRRWLEATDHLIHLSVLLLVPVLIAVVTAVSNAAVELSFLLFPPLAAGAYSLFADPQAEYASPTHFVGGITLGAGCGWLSELVINGDSVGAVDPVAAGTSILLVGVLTWALDIEEPVAYSTALLALVTQEASAVGYVLSVAIGSLLVAGVFVIWRQTVYRRRAELLYGTLSADDHVLVIASDADDSAIHLGASLAGAHDAGRLIIAAMLESDDSPEAVADALEAEAQTVRDRYDLPCDVIVLTGPVEEAIEWVGRETGSDLLVVGVDDASDRLVQAVLAHPLDAVVLRAHSERRAWRRSLVMVARPGDTAHAMVDFASRLATTARDVAVCHCIADERHRRRGERLLAHVVETESAVEESRLAREDPATFVREHAGEYDLVWFGAPKYGGDPLRFLTGSDADRMGSIDCDVALVARGSVR